MRRLRLRTRSEALAKNKVKSKLNMVGKLLFCRPSLKRWARLGTVSTAQQMALSSLRIFT